MGLGCGMVAGYNPLFLSLFCPRRPYCTFRAKPQPSPEAVDSTASVIGFPSKNSGIVG